MTFKLAILDLLISCRKTKFHTSPQVSLSIIRINRILAAFIFLFILPGYFQVTCICKHYEPYTADSEMCHLHGVTPTECSHQKGVSQHPTPPYPPPFCMKSSAIPGSLNETVLAKAHLQKHPTTRYMAK